LNRFLTFFRFSRPARHATSLRVRSCQPQLEGLEDRLVPSTASLTPAGTLVIKETAGTQAHQAQVLVEAVPSGQTSVGDPVTGKILGVFATNQIKSVSVTAPGHDAITFDYENGLMLNPGVSVTMLGGTSASNALTVEGGRFNQGELLKFSRPGGLNTLSLGGNNFDFDSTFRSVDDQANNSNGLILETPGQQILVDESPLGQAYQVTSPGLPTVTFSGKFSFRLNMVGPSGSVANLNLSGACAGLRFFDVGMYGANQTINLNGEASGLGIGFDSNRSGETINVAAVSQSLSSIQGTLQISNLATSPLTLNIHNERHGSDPQGISVQQGNGPVQVNIFESTIPESFTVTGSDNNVLNPPVVPPLP
jgi:hypothetical protein